jgi:hypothetical protein
MASLEQAAKGLRQLRAAEQLVAADRWHESAAAYLVAIRSLCGSGAEQDVQQRAARGLSFALAQLSAEAPIEGRLAALDQALAALPEAACYARAVIHGDVGAWRCRAADFPAALAALRTAVALEPTAPGVLENLQHVLSSAVQRWHFRMLNDSRRNAAYGAAIAAALADLPATASVLDVGTGTGLLAMLAARSSSGDASHVWACDCAAVMTALARECTAANGFGSQISVVDALSTHLSIGSGKKTVFLRYSCIKMIILPRQARDKHRENSKTGRFVAQHPLAAMRAIVLMQSRRQSFLTEWTWWSQVRKLAASSPAFF